MLARSYLSLIKRAKKEPRESQGRSCNCLKNKQIGQQGHKSRINNSI